MFCEEGVKIETYLQSYLIKFDISTTSTLNYCMLNAAHTEFAIQLSTIRYRLFELMQRRRNKQKRNERNERNEKKKIRQFRKQ